MATLTPQQWATVTFLADTQIFEDAVAFVRDNCRDRVPSTAQINGLLQYCDSWKHLNEYVKHQATRDQHKDKDFYINLKSWLEVFKGRLSTEFDLIPSDGTKSEKRTAEELAGGALACQFIQHLVAEVRYQVALRR